MVIIEALEETLIIRRPCSKVNEKSLLIEDEFLNPQKAAGVLGMYAAKGQM
jgi:hypothetical protein